ncbi:MAG: hypothetical protein LBB78_10505 [Spirochaetaceae bacterium]|nr:hypothetical protein [Spirochaetaceae bacterium]
MAQPIEAGGGAEPGRGIRGSAGAGKAEKTGSPGAKTGDPPGRGSPEGRTKQRELAEPGGGGLGGPGRPGPGKSRAPAVIEAGSGYSALRPGGGPGREGRRMGQESRV